MPPRGKKGSAKASKAVQPVEEPVEAPSEPITIHVTGLQRPWQDAELKTKVTNAAGVEISEYRVNDARSEAFITLPSTESGNKAIEELNDKPLNDKPGAKNLVAKVYDPNAAPAEPEPVEEVPAAEEEKKAEGEEKDTLTIKEKRELERKTEEKTTVAEPHLTYLFRAKDHVQHIRKRRGYELDSTTLPGRINTSRANKRKHSEITPASTAKSNDSDAHNETTRMVSDEE